MTAGAFTKTLTSESRGSTSDRLNQNLWREVLVSKSILVKFEDLPEAAHKLDSSF